MAYSADQNPLLAPGNLVSSVGPVVIFAPRKGNENGTDAHLTQSRFLGCVSELLRV